MKYETKQLKSGFSHFETVLLVVVIAVIATVGFAVYQKNNKSKADTDLNAQYMDAKVKGNFETFDSKTASDEESQSANYALSSIGDYQDAAKAENNKGIMASSASAKRKVYWIPYPKKAIVAGKDWKIMSCVDVMNWPKSQKSPTLISYGFYSPQWNGISVELSSKPGGLAKKRSQKVSTGDTRSGLILTRDADFIDFVTYTIRKPGFAMIAKNISYDRIPNCAYNTVVK